MIKFTLTLLGCVISGSVLANTPVSLSADQMDQVTGGSFVCPVIKTENVLNAKNGNTLGPIDGGSGDVYYTVGGPQLPDSVPMHATNGDGSGSPGGPYTAPGDTTYTAIWYQ